MRQGDQNIDGGTNTKELKDWNIISIIPVDTQSLKNQGKSHLGVTELGAEISKPGEQSRDQEMTTLVVCTLVGDVSDGMKTKDGIFEAERKENGQEVVMRSFVGEKQLLQKKAGEEAVSV